ncbi:MAG: MBL fold metallo-hydrolase [Marinilabiliales bacterium]|nr:MAG: MBL fold metallo-hydrolase [Marinilabiliales bacterium]
MKLTVLCDNVAGKYLQAEHGVSYLIEEDIELLFDTGSSDLFLRNAEKLDIDINEIELVVLSHGHYDHGNGLRYLDNKRLVCHPEVFTSRFNKRDLRYLGLNIGREEAEQKFDIQYSREPLQLSEKIYFLGEIPRKDNSSGSTSDFTDSKGLVDIVPDDSAIAVVTKNGLVVVTGCGHAGICNTLEHAKNVTGISKIHAILGGFHLKCRDSNTMQVIEYLKNENVKRVYPSHCVSFEAMIEFYNAFDISVMKTGDILYF